MAQVDSASMMANWINFSTPGEMHTMLAKFDGVWNTEITMWPMPGDPPITAKGLATNKMIMGGRYQESNNSGDLMGMPFEGLSIIGYDNARKIFISTWIDNMGTVSMNMEGPWNSTTNTITFKGSAFDPITMKEANYIELLKIIDDNSYMLEMYAPDPVSGKQYKNVEVKYIRKQ